MNVHDLKLAAIGLPYGDLWRVLTYLPHAWTMAMHGVGGCGKYFFVRSYRIQDGKPVAYDPFWIETCLASRSELPELQARACTPRTKKFAWSPPQMPIARPFGPAEEAERMPCECGRSGYVVGDVSLSPDRNSMYRHALYNLCIVCPKLMFLSERFDPQYVKLHP